MVVEGCPLPITPANSMDSCDSKPAVSHTADTIRMTVSSLLPTVPQIISAKACKNLNSSTSTIVLLKRLRDYDYLYK